MQVVAPRDARLISVDDLARFAVIGDPETLDWNDNGWFAPPGVFSPDGRRVAIIVRRGNPEAGTNDATLTIYRTSDLATHSTIEATVEFSSATNYQPIAQLRWLEDSERLVFAATQAKQRSQIHELDVRTGVVRQLTKEAQQILWYAATPDGYRVATIAERPKRPPADDVRCRERGCRVTVDRFFEVDYGAPGSTPVKVHDLRAGSTTAIANPETYDPSIDFCNEALHGQISPDGRYALRQCVLRELPEWWQQYSADPTLTDCWKQSNVFCVRRLVLIDLQTGATTTVSDAPSMWNQPAPVWIDGGRAFVLAGAMESLTGADAAERARRARSWSVLLVDPTQRRITRIARLDTNVASVEGSSWDAESETLTIDLRLADQADTSAARYRRSGGRWHSIAARASSPKIPRVELRVAQGINDRPVLFALDRRRGGERIVVDPNPWLAERHLGRVEAISWNTKDGITWTGGLYFPPDYNSRLAYPLLIQTHGFEPNQFSLCGASRLFAGQALAAHGVMVLQIAENFRDGNHDRQDTPEEWTTAQAGYEAAIDHLNARGLIDPNRVGVQGWSRTGPQLGYMLTHSSYPIAAAALTETGDFGWLYYVQYAGPKAIESLFGGAPFGEGLRGWLKYSPTFNLDKVKAPIFIWGSGTGGGNWDWYGGLRALGKPVEHWISPEGTHDVFQVGQRLQVTQLLVDWFCFWLKGEEDPLLDKADQYRRWRELRKQQEASLLSARRAVES